MKTFVKLFLLLLIPITAIGQTIVATYEIHDHASGLAYDGNNIWYGRYGTVGERIYKFNIALGMVTDSLDFGTANLDDAYGMTWDGQYLWITNHIGADFTLKVDTLGNIISQFQNPSDYMSGLAWTGTHLYMGDYYNPDGAIYKCNTSGQILESFTAPDLQPWDLAWDGQYLWMCDYNSNYIYQIDPVTHQTVYSFLSPMQDPAGIAWDGQYLWVCDEGQGYSIDHLYKIAPFGAGTPEIQLTADVINFEYVPIDTLYFTPVIISNVGDADLTITGIPENPALAEFWIDSSLTFPFVIAPNASVPFNIYFQPGVFGPLSTVLTVQSDDPINPAVTIDVSGYGIYAQQYAAVNTTLLDFGSVWIPQDGMTGRPFEINNLGMPPLNLISLTIDNPAFTCPEFTAGQVSSMDTLNLTVYFTPTQAIAYQGTMTLITDAPNAPVITVNIQGSGVMANFSQGEVIWRYEAIDPGTFQGFNAVKFTEDRNGDGLPEVIAANENYMTYCINGQSDETGDVFWQFDTGINPLRTGPVEYPRGLVSAPDLNNDGIGDVVLGTGGGSRSVFAVSGGGGSEIWEFDTHNFGGEGGWVYEVTCEADWNSDGIFDVLAGVGGPTGSTEPKSVFNLNGVNGQIIWRAALGETVYSVRSLGDVTGDGRSEVICGTVNNASDYFVKRLNGLNGAVDWNHEVGYAVFSVNRIDDLNGDNLDDVIAAAGSAGVYAISGANGSEIWHITGMGTTYYLEQIEDVNNSGYDDVLVTSVSGTFYALEGRNGAQIWSLALGSNVLSLAVFPDITGDGIDDACCGIMSGSFYAVDGASGTVLFSYTNGTGSNYAFDAVWWMPDIDNSGAVELLGATRDGWVYCFSGGDLEMPGITVNLTPVGAPIVIPPQGGTFQFAAMVENVSLQAEIFDFWTEATLPNGSTVGPLFIRNNLNLPAGGSITRTLSQTVPAAAPAGDYVYTGYVGDFGNTVIYDQSEFAFSKNGVDAGGNIDKWVVSGWEEDDASPFDLTPLTFDLISVYPNPFNASTTITFSLPILSNIELSVYNLQGQKVVTLASGNYQPGVYQAHTGDALSASGVYFVRLMVDGKWSMAKKVVLLK